MRADRIVLEQEFERVYPSAVETRVMARGSH
jgi:hypothetical protein